MKPEEIPHDVNFDIPSPETLGGIYVCLEGDEDVTIRPRQIPPVQIDDRPGKVAVRDNQGATPRSKKSGQNKRARPL